MFLRQSFQQFKKNFYSLFLIELAYMFLMFLFLLFIKSKFKTYLTDLQTYAPQIQELGQTLQQTATPTTELVTLTTNLQGLTTQALFFSYVLIPLGIVLLWTLSQSLEWKIIKQEKPFKNYKTYFFKFFSMTLIAFVLISLVITSLLDKVFIDLALDTTLLSITILFFVVCYFLFLFYIKLQGKSFLQTARTALITGITKIHKVILPYFLLFVSLFFYFFLLLSLYTSYSLESWFLFSPVGLVLYLAVAVAVSLFFKIIFYKAVKACS